MSWSPTGDASTGLASVDDSVRLDLRPIELHLVVDEVAARVVPPPADVLTSEQRAEMAAGEPLSLLRVLGPEGQDGATAGRAAGRRIRAHIADGHYTHRGPAVAVHELRTATHRQVGVVAGIPIGDVRAGRVRPHEQTRAYRESRLAAFLGAAGVDVSPVVLTHPAQPALDALVARVVAGDPDVAFDGWGGVRHRVWIVDDGPTLERFRRAVRPIGQLTIVDGHHRVAAALRSGEGRAVGGSTHGVILAELVADRDLRMVGFDRRVHVPDRAEADRILDRLAEVAELVEVGPEPPDRPDGPAAMLVAFPGRWIHATFTDVPASLPGSLPVSLLQERVLGPIVGIGDPRTDRRLEHVPGLGDLGALERSLGATTLAFVPRAVTMAELQEVARLGRVLPPKSTYVDPKPGPGVLVHLRARGAPIGP